MRNPSRLKTILDFISKQETDAALKLSLWLQKKTQAQQQITQLQQYSQEYLNEKHEHIDTEQILNRQHFLAKLNTAIEQQKEQLSSLEAEIDIYSQTWKKAKSQREGLEKILEKYRLQARTKEERQLQTDLDAYAARKN